MSTYDEFLEEHMTCYVCREVTGDPICCTTENHVICSSCFEMMSSTTAPSCGMCRSSTFSNYSGMRKILTLCNLKVSCGNPTCNYNTHISNIDSHRLICPAREVECPVNPSGCVPVMAKDLIEHLKSHNHRILKMELDQTMYLFLNNSDAFIQSVIINNNDVITVCVRGCTDEILVSVVQNGFQNKKYIAEVTHVHMDESFPSEKIYMKDVFRVNSATLTEKSVDCIFKTYRNTSVKNMEPFVKITSEAMNINTVKRHYNWETIDFKKALCNSYQPKLCVFKIRFEIDK